MTLAAKLEQVVEELELDLRGRVVLTEAATGPYVVTPVLAALAGAEVYAFTRSTRYGTVTEVVEATRILAGSLGIDDGRLVVADILPDSILGRADVVTNSGHLRPLDEAKLQHVRPGAVVALMFESWELRDADLDLGYLRRRGIRTVATNERHPDVDVFNYLGELAVRQIHLAGLSLTRNRFALFCNNPFGPYLARTLGDLCAELVVFDDRDDPGPYGGLDITWAGRYDRLDDRVASGGITGLVIAAYPFDREWIGTTGPMDPAFVRKHFPGAVVLRFAGHVDEVALLDDGIACYPPDVPVGHMGSLLSDLGPDPVIRLQAGSLKAAEVALAGGDSYRGTPILELL